MEILEKQASVDGSIKYLWGLPGGNTVESIFFRLDDAPHVCISTQIGCNVACLFCETGKQPSLGNLTAAEIEGQVSLTRDDLSHGPETPGFHSVILAGMGEPLHNFEAVAEATDRLLASGLTEHVTITTSGVVPRMRDLPAIAISKLSVSLHATTDDVRDMLVPINKKYPIAEVIEAAAAYKRKTGNEVIMNYLLFDGVNDSDEDAERLAALLDPALFTVKFKEWNAIEGTALRKSPDDRYERFEQVLAERGFDVTVCLSRGVDVGGGCGQLRSKNAPTSAIWMRRGLDSTRRAGL